MDENDDQRHTPFNVVTEQSSSETITSQSTESVLPADDETDQNLISSRMSHVHVYPIKVENVCIQPNLTIKHPNRSDDQPFTEEQRTIIDKHVHVSHINRSTLQRLTTDLSLLSINPHARRKSTGTIVVSLPNKRNSGNNRHRLISRQNTVRISRVSTTNSVKQDLHRQHIPSKMKENVIHVCIRQKNSKTSS